MTRADANEQEPSGWSFGTFELTAERGLVRGDGSEVSLAAKPLAMLIHLLRARDRVVSRSELQAAIWPDVSVSPAAVDSVLRDLRRALRRAGSNETLVRTFRSRGLRFVAPVRELRPEAADAWQQAAQHFERALASLDLLQAGRGGSTRGNGGGARTRAELLVALASARWAGGSTAEARAAFLEAAEIGRRAGDHEILPRAALGYAGRTDATPGVNRQAVALLEESLRLLPSEPGALRAEVMARLGTELHYDDDPQRSLELTRQALEMADRVGDPELIAYVLTARHFAMQRPEFAPRDRWPFLERVLSLSSGFPVSDVGALAHQRSLVDCLEAGDGAGFRRALEAFRRASHGLDQPFFAWLCGMFEGTATLLAGEIDEAERRAHETFEIGRRMGTPNAEAALAGQLFGVRREQQRLGELAPLLRDVAQRPDALPILRVGHAAVLAEGRSPEAARREVRATVDDILTTLPRDQDWLASLGTLAPAVAELGRDDQRALLREWLWPFRDRVIVVGQGATIHGAVSHHLGHLCVALGAHEAARRCFEEALALHRQLDAKPWTRRTEQALAQLGPDRIPG